MPGQARALILLLGLTTALGSAIPFGWHRGVRGGSVGGGVPRAGSLGSLGSTRFSCRDADTLELLVARGGVPFLGRGHGRGSRDRRGGGRKGAKRGKPEVSFESVLQGLWIGLSVTCRVFVKKSVGLGIAYALWKASSQDGSSSKSSDQLSEAEISARRKRAKEDLEDKVADGVREVKEGGANLLRGVKDLLRGLPIRVVSTSDLPDINAGEENEVEMARARMMDAAAVAAAATRNAAKSLVLKPGDHLCYNGAFGFKTMSHHAIYVGDGTIVHFTGGAGDDTSYAAKKAARITKEGVGAIIQLANKAGALLEVVPRPDNALPRDEIVERSLSRVGDAGYNLILSNCEHFALWCVTGESRSRQVLEALQAPARFVSDVINDVMELSRHPLKGKPVRHVIGTLKTALAVLSAHLTFFSW